MKKYFLIAVLLMSMTGLASAANVPNVVDPTEGPETWVTSVYNNSGGTLDAGDVVVWDVGSSVGDDDNWVTTTTTTDTNLVAGVVHGADIAAGSSGAIAIYGMTTVDVITSGTGSNIAAGTILCTSGTAGAARACADPNDPGAIGHAVAAVSSGTVKAFVKP